MLEIVNVDIDAQSLDWRAPQAWLSDLTRHIGPESGERVVFMPPLLANVMCLSPGLLRHGLGRATTLAMARRPLRFASVFFAYPGIGRKRLPWAVMHDRVEMFLRDGLGGLARETGSTVITTVLADHPRTHWEAWPERGDLYHSVQTIRPDGDPVAALRQRRPKTSFKDTIDIDPEDGQTGCCVRASDRLIGVVWDGDSVSVPEFQQVPAVVWCPRVRGQGAGVEPANLIRGSEQIEAVVSTGTSCSPKLSSSVYTRQKTGALGALTGGENVAPGLQVTRVQLDL